jgi:hypothetical protein
MQEIKIGSLVKFTSEAVPPEETNDDFTLDETLGIFVRCKDERTIDPKNMYTCYYVIYMQEVGMNYYFARREFDVIQAK